MRERFRYIRSAQDLREHGKADSRDQSLDTSFPEAQRMAYRQGVLTPDGVTVKNRQQLLL
ncbi:MAG: hypothetical protein LAT57_00220 [Balneolales bacterium]|nr:hypothetical protein [Balneolales bacterium]